jgi:urease accessory protein UreF
MTDLAALLATLQFADGLFPSGGFAHSFGLETYAQDGAVRDAAGLRELVRVRASRPTRTRARRSMPGSTR